MLRSFAHPVACCCAEFETGQTFSKRTQQCWSIGQHCCVRSYAALQVLLTGLNGNESILRESIVVRFTRLHIATVQSAEFVVLCFPGIN